jgi:hypothetical protein
VLITSLPAGEHMYIDQITCKPAEINLSVGATGKFFILKMVRKSLQNTGNTTCSYTIQWDLNYYCYSFTYMFEINFRILIFTQDAEMIYAG